ncbi:MAG: MBL fold metallo-hydrolase [Candidatus Atribacteria bacterium]|nr:MAG: MBL fold metallo-hydrolase [Candidatus Atribacteria bacterium]
MKRIAEGVYLLEGLRGCNTYLLVSGSSLALVDAGLGKDVDQIISQIEEAGFDPFALETIVVTHAHPDHIGGLAGLARRLHADILAHRLEAPIIEGRAQLPARTALQKAMNWLGRRNPQVVAGKLDVARRLEDGDMVDALGGLRVLHTPGHTPGCLCLLQEEKGALFCGDLLFNGNPLTGRGGLRYAPRAFSVDPDEVSRSAQSLSSLTIHALCMGHGEPLVYENGVTMEEVLKTISR